MEPALNSDGPNLDTMRGPGEPDSHRQLISDRSPETQAAQRNLNQLAVVLQELPPQVPDEFSNTLELPRRSDAPAIQIGESEVKLSEHSFH